MRFDDDQLDDVIREAIRELPGQFRAALEHVVIDVEELPDENLAERLQVSRYGLLGLYHGTPLTKQSVEQVLRLPARIVLYKSNIERICRNRSQAVAQIRKTLLHEIGHHFGLDEADLRELGYG